MSDLRTAAQQALEFLDAEFGWSPGEAPRIDNLRAALAQQKDPTDPGNDVDVLREHVRHLERRVRQLHAQQAEPVEPHRWEGDNNIESPFNACMHKTYCMTLKQAEPLNLSDPAVQKRLATQWGYVPAALAEPVQEPVAWIESPHGAIRANPNYKFTFLSQLLQWQIALHTAPPQRKPLTDEEAAKACGASGNLGPLMQIVRAVERAHGIKEN